MCQKSPLLLRASKFYISKVGAAEDSHLNLLRKQSRMVENLMVLASLLNVFSIRLLLVFNSKELSRKVRPVLCCQIKCLRNSGKTEIETTIPFSSLGPFNLQTNNRMCYVNHAANLLVI